MIKLDSIKILNICHHNLVHLDEGIIYYSPSKNRNPKCIFVNDNQNSILKRHSAGIGSIRNYGVYFEKVLDD